MARYRVYRSSGNTYNPYWLKLILKTKTGADRSDWITLILAWETFAEEGNWDPWIKLEKDWKKQCPKVRELKRITRGWKLTFTQIVGTGRGLTRSEKQLFDKIKRALRSRGEGKACWACGASPQDGELGLDAHEFWNIDFKRRIRSLKTVRFLCTDCHYLVHRGNVMFLGPNEDMIRLAELFCRVNKCKVIEAYGHFTSHGFGYPYVANWKIDLSQFDLPLD